MKKRAAVLFLSCVSLLATAQVKQNTLPKYAPLTKSYLHDLHKNPNSIPNGYVYNRIGGQTYVSALIKVADAPLAQAGLNGINAHVGTKAGKVWTVKVPVNQVIAFSQLSGISYIQLDEPMQPQLDVARKTTRVDSAHGGYGLPMAYSGKDVVVGVIDFGFDYNHPTFYDTLGTTYRIKRAWEMGSTGTPPAGYTYGSELTTEAAIKAAGTDNPKQSHGTATAGMAAGSGFGSPGGSSRFRGMAYDADIVMVGVRRDSIGGQWIQGTFTDFIDGISYIFGYATSVSKPAVTNISWGSQSGSHDGTSLISQACDAMSGDGRVIVLSAGNDGTSNIHLSKTFTPTDTVISSFLTFSPPVYKRTWIDIWGEPAKTFCGKVSLYSGGLTLGQTTNYICLNDTVTDMYLIGANGLDTCYVRFISSTAEDNGKPRMTIDIYNKATDSVAVSVRSTDGLIHMWNEYYYYGFPYRYQSTFANMGAAWATTGNTVSTVSDMGSGNSVLLVGAYASKVDFTDINGNPWSYSGYVGAGRVVPFSSRGPMTDGRIKPDITAPGLTIATAMTSYDTSYTATGSNSQNVIAKYTASSGRDYYFAEFSGTSASAPAAAGIVALMLQANPSLSATHAREIIFETAIKDAFTGALPTAGNNSWGHGKINAYGALKKIAQELSVYEFKGRKIDCMLFPNPNDGSFSLDYTADSYELLSVTVFDMAGRIVQAKEWSVTTGQNRTKITMPQAAPGNYIVKIAATTGSVNIRTTVK